jgi:citrate lyase subunit beta/citryl-CoA lyase
MSTDARSNRRGEAGRRGDDVRSDLHAGVEIRDGGGVEIEVRSRVEPYYGSSIRAEVRSVLDRLGVEHARVEIADQGGLPFVIAARVEGAARAAGATGGDARPERSAPLPKASTRDRLRRSRLYLPGNEPKFMVNAGLHGPDAVILDLEDSVHPEHKDAARLLVRNALRCVDFGSAERMIRINQLPLGFEDLEAVVPDLPDLILVPKVEDPEQIREIDGCIERILGRTGDDRPIWLMPILESARGIENAFEIASSSRRVCALTLGLEDYTADLGVAKTTGGDESHYARMRVVNAARAAGVQAIDSVFGDVGDTEGLRRWGVRARRMGYEGMGCVHPRQIAVIHHAFRPSDDEIQRAARIVAAFEDAEARGLGVVSLGSKMIDPPVVERARKLVDRARTLGLLPLSQGISDR